MSTACIIGDIHGRADYLRELIDKVRERHGSGVRIIGIGDYIDRGPDSRGVLDICVGEGIEGIVGNHDLWLGRYLNTGSFDPGVLHWSMGGFNTIDSYTRGTGVVLDHAKSIEQQLANHIPPEHQTFLDGLKIWINLEVAGVTYRLTHGGVKSYVVEHMREALGERAQELVEDRIVEVVAQAAPDTLLWVHHKSPEDVYRFRDGSVQVFGHMPCPQVESTDWYIALDTGSGRKKKKPCVLSAVVLPSEGGREIITGGQWVGPEPSEPA